VILSNIVVLLVVL